LLAMTVSVDRSRKSNHDPQRGYASTKARNVSRKDAKAAKKMNKIVFRTWRSSRLGGRNIRGSAVRYPKVRDREQEICESRNNFQGKHSLTLLRGGF
jgi:hypothetical protein